MLHLYLRDFIESKDVLSHRRCPCQILKCG